MHRLSLLLGLAACAPVAKDTDVAAVPAGDTGAPAVWVPDDYATVQGAVDAAAPGEWICVRAGTYVGTVDFGGKDLVVASEEGPRASPTRRPPIQTSGTSPSPPPRRSWTLATPR